MELSGARVISGAQWMSETNKGAKWNDNQVEWGDWLSPQGVMWFIFNANYNTAFTLNIRHTLCSKISSFDAITAGMKKTDEGDEYLDFLGKTLEQRWIIIHCHKACLTVVFAASEMTMWIAAWRQFAITEVQCWTAEKKTKQCCCCRLATQRLM